MMTSANRAWIEVSSSNPCPICHKPDWCRVRQDCALCACRRVNNGTGETRIDKSGGEYYLYRLGQDDDSWPEPTYSHANGGKLADADTRHRTYCAITNSLPLHNKHLADLCDRGLQLPNKPTNVLAKELGYRSLGRERPRAVQRVIQAGFEKDFPGVPGLFVQEKDGRRWWTLSGGAGLLIPVRDEKKRIVALVVRLDEAKTGRYQYLSTKKRGGAGPSSPVHVPIIRPASDTVRITEGYLKADLSTTLSGILTIGLPGVNSWRRARKVLRKLKAKKVRLAFDADYRTNRHVARALVNLYRDLKRRHYEVDLETWHPAAGKGIDDVLKSGKTIDVLAGAQADSVIDSIAEAAEPQDTSAGRPKLDAGNEDLAVIAPQAIELLAARNRSSPRLFNYGNQLSRMEFDNSGAPLLRLLTFERMRYELAQAIYFFKLKRAGQEYVEVAALPPKAMVETVLATPAMPLPVLNRIVEAPVFTADGALHSSPGFNRDSKIYYANAFDMPPIPDKPSHEEIGDAATFLWYELLGDFPFVGDAEKAHALAVLILTFARDLIQGATPFHLFEKPCPGTGATLLVEVLLYPATGRPVPVLTEARDEDEWRKRIFAKLRAGPLAFVIDNLRRRLDSAALSSAITAWPLWEDRLLGYSESVRVPANCIWIGTGNNPALSSEISRRTVRIRMDAKIDQPWLRQDFRHPNLRAWVAENRGKLAAAVLTLIQAWIAAGRPEGKKVLGMFESWSKVMGGIFDVAGIDGFLGNLEETYEESDTEGAAWRSFVAQWWDKHGDQEQGVADLWPIASADGLHDLGDGGQHSQQVKLGILLRKNRDRIFTLRQTVTGPGLTVHENVQRLRIERGNKVRRAVMWRLVETN